MTPNPNFKSCEGEFSFYSVVVDDPEVRVPEQYSYFFLYFLLLCCSSKYRNIEIFVNHFGKLIRLQRLTHMEQGGENDVYPIKKRNHMHGASKGQSVATHLL